MHVNALLHHGTKSNIIHAVVVVVRPRSLCFRQMLGIAARSVLGFAVQTVEMRGIKIGVPLKEGLSQIAARPGAWWRLNRHHACPREL